MPQSVIKHDSALDKAGVAFVNFTDKHYRAKDALSHFLQDNDRAKLSTDQKAARIDECIRLERDIDPYDPPGVDPRLASAIRKARDTHITMLEEMRENMTTWFGGTHVLDRAHEATMAEEDVVATFNALTAEAHTP